MKKQSAISPRGILTRTRATAFLLLLLLLLPFCLSACNDTPAPPGGDPGDGGTNDGGGTGDGGGQTDDNNTDGDTNTEDSMKGIFLNIDSDTRVYPFLRTVTANESVTEEDLYPFMDQYANTQITDVAICILTQVSNTLSDVRSDIMDSYYRTEENGVAVDYKADLEHYHKLYEVYHIDPYAVWFARCREIGITPWLTMRMNDCHCHEETAHWLLPDEFYEAKEKGWYVGEAYGYQHRCLDYGVKEVRDKMLAYIEEQLSRYDVDGFELDFSREWVCFDYLNNPDCYLIMNDFLRAVKAIVEGAEAKWGHDIKINIRLMRDIEENKVFGFDVDTIVAEKLADILTVCPRWATNDSHMPFAEWKERYPDIPIYAGLCDLHFRRFTDYATLAGYAAAYLAEGADKIYVYNMFMNPFTPNIDNGPVYREVYKTFGSLDTLLDKTRYYTVTYQDLPPLPKDEYPGFNPFPNEFNGFRAPLADGFSMETHTGPVGDERDAYLILGFNRELGDTRLTVEANYYELDLVGKADPALMKNYKDYFSEHLEMNVVLYCYRFPARVVEERNQLVTLETKADDLTVCYMQFIYGADEAPLE